MLELTGAVQYYLARRNATIQVMQQANYDMEQSQRIAHLKGEVEGVIQNSLDEVKKSLATPGRYYAIMSRIVASNQHIVGAGIAFKPGYYPDSLGHSGLYAPYAYDETPESARDKKNVKPSIRSRLLPFDYTEREWFSRPMELSLSLWTEPYMDIGGPNIVMCTYTVPIRDIRGDQVAILFADVPLKDLSKMASHMYEGIDKTGLVVLMLQIFAIIVMGLIIWRATVAYRRHKESNYDPEKERLAEKVAKLTEVNRRLTERNMKLAEKLQQQNEQKESMWYVSYSDEQGTDNTD